MKPGDRVTLKPPPLHVERVGDTQGFTWVRQDVGPGSYLLPTAWLDIPAVMAGGWLPQTLAAYPRRLYPGGARAAWAGAHGWEVLSPEGIVLSFGPETGDEGMACADACLRAAGRLPPLPAWVPAVGDRVEVPGCESRVGVVERLVMPGPTHVSVRMGPGVVWTLSVADVRPAPQPAPAWTPSVGDRVDASNMGIGIVAETRMFDVGLLYFVRLDAGGGMWWKAEKLRPAPQPAPKVAPAWVEVTPGVWRRGAVAVVYRGGYTYTGQRLEDVVPGLLDAPLAVRLAHVDAHLTADGYTLAGGPVEGVRVRLTYRPTATVAEVVAFEAGRQPSYPRALDAVAIGGSILIRDWCPVAAWLIAHPEAPIDWVIEVAS